MLNRITPALYLVLIFAQYAVSDRYIELVQGLLRSEKGDVVKYINDIPCDVVQTLETDADEAEQFVTQLTNGQVPSIFQDLPDDAVLEFRDLFNIALSLPTEIADAAEAAATDAVKVFNDIEDGSIVQDIESIPGIILSDITSGWADFTSELTGAWDDVTSGIGCFFGNSKDCAQPTAVGSCPAAAAATTTNYGAAATSYGAAATTQNAAAQATTLSTAQPTGATSNGAAATTQNAAAQASTLSPAQPTGATSNGAAATSQNAALSTTPSSAQPAGTTSNGVAAAIQSTPQSSTPSPAQPTGGTSLASIRSNWAAGLGVWVTTAIVVFACALYL